MKISRRDSFKAGAALAASIAVPKAMAVAAEHNLLRGKAEHVIAIWLGGGMGQIDTFDPKRTGDAEKGTPGAYYNSIPTAVKGVEVCEHLGRTAPLMDRMTAVRTLHHDVIDEHAAATNFMHTGRGISGTVTYPSLGSLVASELGVAEAGVPAYVLIGYPNVTRGPGFLGAKHGYLYLTDTSQGPAGLSRPPEITPGRQARREKMLAILRNRESGLNNQLVREYEATMEESTKLSGPKFNRVFDLEKEPAKLRRQYGGEFGQRCLLSRRLVERGVRFIEVSHNLNFLNGAGWDVHNEGILKQHALIQELDRAVAALLQDLESKKLLDKTLVVINTEFGRPPEFDSGGGRGHQGSAFTCVVAGGGLRHCGAWGETDELSNSIVSSPVGVPDYFATILAAVGIDYTKNLHHGDRPVPITDGGQPISNLFA